VAKVKDRALQTVTSFRIFYRLLQVYRCFGKLVVNRRPENKGHVTVFTAKYGIERVQVFAYHLAANGMVERGHKPITDALEKLTDRGLGNWVRNLSTVFFTDRTSVHQPTSKTPFWIVYK
jgi:hypothetical protein